MHHGLYNLRAEATCPAGQPFVRARNHLHADDFAHLGGGSRAGVGGRFHRRHVAAEKCRHVDPQPTFSQPVSWTLAAFSAASHASSKALRPFVSIIPIACSAMCVSRLIGEDCGAITSNSASGLRPGTRHDVAGRPVRRLCPRPRDAGVHRGFDAADIALAQDGDQSAADRDGLDQA